MTEPHPLPPEPPHDRELTEMQKRVTERARETIERQQNVPRPTMGRRILTMALAILVVLALVFIVDLVVRGFHRLVELYTPEPAPVETPAAPPTDPNLIFIEPIPEEAPPAETPPP